MHHFQLLNTWALLPFTFAAALSTPPSRQALTEASIQSIHIDNTGAQASFIVPCANCLGTETGYTNQSFLFDFEAFPSQEPCGTSNLSLNGVPITPEWESTGVYAQGLASVNSSGHELNLFLRSDCLFGDESSSAGDSQLLTLTIEKVDRKLIPTLSGFTVSFKQYPEPDLLRLSLVPDFRARDPSHSEDWRAPPSNLRLHLGEDVGETYDFEDVTSFTIEEQIEGLRQLERQAELLQRLIKEKKQIIDALSEESSKALREEIKECESIGCALKAIITKLHRGAKKFCVKIQQHHRQFHEAFSNRFFNNNQQAPTTMSQSVNAMEKSSHNITCVQSPEAAHCRNGQPTDGPPPAYAPASGNSRLFSDSKTQPSAPHTSSQPDWQEAKRPSALIILLKTLFIITGLSLLCCFIRKRCMSLRTRAERAADRERRTAERLYRRDARRQAWRDWWFGRRRGQPGRRQGDYDEKRILILRQEGILEEAMQDDIRQLQIQEEIRQLRNTRDVVDDLVRAEEGRVTRHYGQHVPSSSASTSYNPFARGHPTPITIPNMASVLHPSNPYTPHNLAQLQDPYHRNHNPFSSSHDDETTLATSPLSRTSSLPDYKTEASSQTSGPPSYDGNDDSVADGFSDYSPSTGSAGNESLFSPGSSIPDISPRPSIETARTFL
ncbi:hypothetical protein EJ08DRAFT_692827 [Tothia fuscella]|uniref:Uncharacterized protein n=1 Tax=Tothia fuscella TaxID=1048955 RepID=A0A9P4P1K8_9PEZI|nr:hypothetical protein EJ08DRAFT_692827 [Tothia fuscella]